MTRNKSFEKSFGAQKSGSMDHKKVNISANCALLLNNSAPFIANRSNTRAGRNI